MPGKRASESRHYTPDSPWLVVEHNADGDDSVLFSLISRGDAEEIARSLRATGQDVTVQPRPLHRD
jgi:hypothetical protein